MFAKLAEIPVSLWITLFVFVVLGVALLALRRTKVKWSARMLAFAALSVALAFVLSFIRLFRFPQGGSITPASMLPLLLFAYAFGTVPGICAGVVYGLLQFLQGAMILNLAQVLLDYPIAFGVLGLAGLFRKKAGTLAFPAGALIACFGRFAAAVLSGVVFFAEYAGEQNPWIYSAVYNGTYMLPETLICVLVGILLVPRLVPLMKRS